MEGQTYERNSSAVGRSTSSSVHSSQNRASSYRVTSSNPENQSVSRRQCDRYHREECGKQMTSPEEKSVLPISINNSPRQQISDTSTQVYSLNSSISEPVCRICHGTSNTEQLLSLCYCAGSIGLMHVSCLQRWLGSSNKTQCELCHFNFAMERKPKPFYVYLSNSGSKEDRRRLLFDLICVCLLTPSTLTVVSLCVYGATNYSPHRPEFAGLVLLGTLLMTLFIVWLVICLRINLKKWNEWKQFNQKVKLKCSPPVEHRSDTEGQRDGGFRADVSRQRSQMGVKISSIEIKVVTEGQNGGSDHRSLRTSLDSKKSALNSISRPLPIPCDKFTDDSFFPQRRLPPKSDDTVQTEYMPRARERAPGRAVCMTGEQVVGNCYISSSSSKDSMSVGRDRYRTTPRSWNISPPGQNYRPPSMSRPSSKTHHYDALFRENESSVSGASDTRSETRSKSAMSYHVHENKGVGNYNPSVVYPRERYI